MGWLRNEDSALAVGLHWFVRLFLELVMRHDNRSEGNRVADTFVYAHLSKYEGEEVLAAGFYRVDVHPDAATGL